MEEIFKALAEESRLRILSLLLDGDLCVCELENCLNLKQSNISRHLSSLKKSGIVDSYKKAQWNYYRINKEFIQNNYQLWLYLKEKLVKIPTYEKDKKRMEENKNNRLCDSLSHCECK